MCTIIFLCLKICDSFSPKSSTRHGGFTHEISKQISPFFFEIAHLRERYFLDLSSSGGIFAEDFFNKLYHATLRSFEWAISKQSLYGVKTPKNIAGELRYRPFFGVPEGAAADY